MGHDGDEGDDEEGESTRRASKTNQTKKKDQRFIAGVVEGFYGRPWSTEQRGHLFVRMAELRLNTYLYAPKDDLKHRNEWRVLYSTEEMEYLQGLIKSATENGITFVYALSPGIDIVYSSQKDGKAVQEKLDQVKRLGCHAFALLFDDIETELNEADRKAFSSFAIAQLTVANAAFEYLGNPMFFFCPTGPRVVSRILPCENMRRVGAVLRRKPLIWDNLHANDYDPKRVFLGPFSGRPVKLREEISGLLLNPNCEYEANFNAFHTMADWNEADADADVEHETDATLEAGGVEPVAEQVVNKANPLRLYHPLKSLRSAQNKWSESFRAHRTIGRSTWPVSVSEPILLAGDLNAPIEHESESATVPVAIPPPIQTCEGNELAPIDVIYTSPSTQESLETTTVQSITTPTTAVSYDLHNSALSVTVNSLTHDYTEPMDDLLTIREKENSPGEAMDSSTGIDAALNTVEDAMEIESGSGLSEEMLSTLVDMFYLPFEHGDRARRIVDEFVWLRENVLALARAHNDNEPVVAEEWRRRCDRFLTAIRNITELLKAIVECPNKALVNDLYPYIWELQSVTCVVDAVISWMAEGHFDEKRQGEENGPNNGSSIVNEETMDQEPWVIRGGLIGDLQKLLVSSPSLADLFMVRPPIPLALTSFYRIRPYRHDDRDEVFAFVRTTFESADSSFNVNFLLAEKYRNLVGDRYVAPWLDLVKPSMLFVAEEMNDDQSRMVGFVAAAFKARQLNNWDIVTRIKKDYPDADDIFAHLSDAKELSHELHQPPLPIFSDSFYEKYSSAIELRCHMDSTDTVAARRLLLAVTSTLTLSGATGFFVHARSSERRRIELYKRLGLTELSDVPIAQGYTVLGRCL